VALIYCGSAFRSPRFRRTRKADPAAARCLKADQESAASPDGTCYYFDEQQFAIFDTAIRTCGIVWNVHGVAGVQIHDGTEGATRAHLLRRFAGAKEEPPPAHVQRAIDGIVALLCGENATERRDARYWRSAGVQSRSTPFARTIPPGSTLTYGEIAERLGDRLLARDVGQALGQNPIPLIVPPSSCARGRRQARRLFGSGRRRQQAPSAEHRRCTAERSDIV
jgi:methylated-DNA-[protein]-cysteine S-methyltransferase